MLIVRLIADAAGLSAKMEAVRADLAGRGVASEVRGLAEPGVVEIRADTADAAMVRAVLDAHVAPADGLIADHVPQVPHLFISDMDSTMIGQECIDELADFAGLKPRIAAITERAMQGELDFQAALRERVALLGGLSEEAIARCLAERIRPMAGAKLLVATLKARGCRTVLVTGGFHQFADPVAQLLGFDHVVANRLEVTEGRLTGKLVGPICDSTTKLATLQAEVAGLEHRAKKWVPVFGEKRCDNKDLEHHAPGGDVGAISLATGDGANDIPMIAAATYGMAYHAKPKARAAASGWVDHGDLTAVLHLLDIPRETWVE